MAAGTYHLPVLAAASTTAISATPAEINLIDGGASSSSITLADGDGFIVNDGGTMKLIPASDIKTYVADASLQVNAQKANGNDLESGVNFFASSSLANTAVNLPASPAAGDQVFIKAMSNCSNTRLLTVSRQGSHTIDGETSIVLESPNAAVQCIFIGNDEWKIF